MIFKFSKTQQLTYFRFFISVSPYFVVSLSFSLSSTLLVVSEMNVGSKLLRAAAPIAAVAGAVVLTNKIAENKPNWTVLADVNSPNATPREFDKMFPRGEWDDNWDL